MLSLPPIGRNWQHSCKMAALSKVYCSCYELGHCWTPYCTKASLDVALIGYSYAFKIYAVLYLVAALIKRRKKEDYVRKVLPDILRSTLFLGTNAVTFISSFCLWRRALGCFLFLTSSYIPAAFASFIAINLERKSRRSLLAVYMLNVGMETAYRMLSSRGMLLAIPNGEVLLFSVVTSLFMYLLRHPVGPKDGMFTGIKLLVGSDELPSSDKKENQNVKKRRKFQLPPFIKALLYQLRNNFSKHQLCQHKYSCTSYWLEGSLRNFGIGFGIQMIVKILGSLRMAAKRPRALLEAIFHKNNFQLGAFLGSLTGLFRLVNCMLRRIRNKDDAIHGAVAGFVAGSSMMFYKSTTITLWLVSKLAEILYFRGIDAGLLPHIPFGDIVIYTLCTSLVFHAAVFEPHNLRPAYWSFLQRITDNKFGQMNRKLIDVYGTQASKMFPNYKPNYDPRFTDLR